ncbi:Uncharacterised protein [Mycobacteroides abscessus]|nr:Uncharacterised protein [Mycobacteroides abscessus]
MTEYRIHAVCALREGSDSPPSSPRVPYAESLGSVAPGPSSTRAIMPSKDAHAFSGSV